MGRRLGEMGGRLIGIGFSGLAAKLSFTLLTVSPASLPDASKTQNREPLLLGVPGTGIYWTQRVSPAASLHAGRRWRFVFGVVAVVLLVIRALS